MSDPLGHAVARSARRCRLREQAIVMLSSMGEAHPRALAFAIGVDPTRLKRIMHGYLPDYSEILAPITLGLAVYERTREGWRYTITEKGRGKARQLTARRVRDAAARRARAEAAGRRRMDLAPSEPPAQHAPAPATSWSTTCTYTWC